MAIKSKYIWINGELLDYENATIHFLNPTMHYGAATFEGIRAYSTAKGAAVFRLKEHIERLFESCRVLGIREFDFSVDQIIEATCQVVKENGFTECYIRPLVYFTGESMGLNLDAYKVNFGIAAWEWGNYLGEESRAKGVRACVSSFTRLHPNASMTKAKISGNYANSILAKTESVRLGFDEAIMLDPEGYVSECTGENLFLVKDKEIIASPITSTLEGITRNTIITLARDHQIAVREMKISRDQLYTADEVFLCGTAAEVIGISEIDFRKIGIGMMGEITASLQQEYIKAVHGESPRSKEWLTVA